MHDLTLRTNRAPVEVKRSGARGKGIDHNAPCMIHDAGNTFRFTESRQAGWDGSAVGHAPLHDLGVSNFLGIWGNQRESVVHSVVHLRPKATVKLD